MELYASKDKKIIAIVDYAHNKLSFEKLFSSIREEYPDYAIKQSLVVRERKPISAERIWGPLPDSTHRKSIWRQRTRAMSRWRRFPEISHSMCRHRTVRT